MTYNSTAIPGQNSPLLALCPSSNILEAMRDRERATTRVVVDTEG